MAHLSLRERIPMVRQKLGLETFNFKTLRRYYKLYGVAYKRPSYSYWKSMAEKEGLKQKQLEFAEELGTIIKQNAYEEIVYIDETTFHLWQKMRKGWVRPGMKLSLVNSRGPSITVIGGISERRGLVHYHIIAESNNTEHFQDFLAGLKKKCEGRRTLLILDNLKIHYAKRLNPLYDQSFKIMFLPPYSSELNPIESFWSLLKHRWQKNLLLYGEELQGIKRKRPEEQRTKMTVLRLKETIGKEEISLRLII
jgi:transposase